MIKIINQKNIPLLFRKIVTLSLSYVGATPKKESIKKEVADFLKTKQDLIVLKNIYPKFGEETAEVTVHVYNKIEDLKRVEEIKKKVKTAEKEKTKKTETTKPEKKTEEPKKEEKPKEA